MVPRSAARRVWAFGIAAVLVTACDDTITVENWDPNPLTLTPMQLDLQVGDSAMVAASMRDLELVVFEVEDTAVARISRIDHGNQVAWIEALRVGQTRLRADAEPGGKRAFSEVTVTAPQ